MGLIPGLAQWVKDPCGVDHRRGSDLVWLWPRPPAIAPTRPLAWEPPYATEVALEMAKRQKRKKERKKAARGVPIVA